MLLRSTAVVLPTLLLLAALPQVVGAAEESVPAAAAAAGTPLPASLAGLHACSRALKEDVGDAAAPASEIESVTAQSKAVWTKRADGAWIAPRTSRPAQDVITLAIAPKTGGSFLRLDFPIDPTLPGRGPGQADNGNAILGEIEVEVAGQPVKAQIHSSVSRNNGVRVVASAFDGVKQKGDAGWESQASGWELGPGKPAQVVLQLEKPVAAGTPVTVRLTAKTKWVKHVPGAVGAAVLGDADTVKAAAQFEALDADYRRWCDDVRAAGRQGGAAIAKAELLRAASEAQVFAILRRKDGHAFLATFLADQPWLESFLLGGQEGTVRTNYTQALENLRLLFSQSPPATWSDPISKRVAAAVALEAGAMNRYRLVARFRLIEQARAQGRLYAGFDQLDVRAMRHAINLEGPAFEFNGWLDEAQFTPGGYVGACWMVPYTNTSVYNYGIQGWGFHEPLRHAYPTASIFRLLGGVCGTLSRFGAISAYTHGVPAFTVGQTGHCAYIVRIGDRWATGNDVSGPAGNYWSAYENTGFITTAALLEKTENAQEYLPAQRLVWAARTAKAAGEPAAAWKASYEAALAAQPLNYAAWLEYVKALQGAKNPPAAAPAEWNSLAERVATAFKEHQEAAWVLAITCLRNGKEQLPTPADRAEKLLALHAILNKKAAPKMYGYDLPMFLDGQAQFIGDDNQAVDFFGKLLAIHHSDDPALNWGFGMVMSWGARYFNARPAVSLAYTKIIGGYFEAEGDKARMPVTFAAGIQKSSEIGDASAYHAWQELATKLLPPLKPADVHLPPAHLAKRPKIEPFPGILLSAGGMLQTSGVSGGKPLSYGQVTGGGELGYFDTPNQSKPWAGVALEGESEISGIVLVNRYELAPDKRSDVALKVEVSSDGKTWTQVALLEQPQDIYRVDLQGAPPHAKFVRVEGQPKPKAGKPGLGRVQLRNFLVYGKKLY